MSGTVAIVGNYEATPTANPEGDVQVAVTSAGVMKVTPVDAAGAPSDLYAVDIQQVGGVAVDNDEPAAITPAPFTTPTTTQVAMSTTIAQIVAADGTRRRLFVCCSAAMFIGPSGITASTGLLLPANVPFEVPTPTAALYGITASGTPNVTVMIAKD